MLVKQVTYTATSGCFTQRTGLLSHRDWCTRRGRLCDVLRQGKVFFDSKIYSTIRDLHAEKKSARPYRLFYSKLKGLVMFSDKVRLFRVLR